MNNNYITTDSKNVYDKKRLRLERIQKMRSSKSNEIGTVTSSIVSGQSTKIEHNDQSVYSKDSLN